MSEYINNNNEEAEESTSNNWSILENSPEPGTVWVEKSKDLCRKTKERDELEDGAWDKLNESQKASLNNRRLSNVDLLTAEAKNQENNRPQEIVFSGEQIEKLKQLSGNLGKLFVASGADLKKVKDWATKTSVADAMLHRANFGLEINEDDLRNTLKETSEIILSLNMQGDHLGAMRMSNKALDGVLAREDNAIRHLTSIR